MINLPALRLRLPAATPLVSRSPMLNASDVIVIDGGQFEDDRRRIVVGPGLSDETVKALESTLLDHERIDGMRRWFTDLIGGDPESHDSGDHA